MGVRHRPGIEHSARHFGAASVEGLGVGVHDGPALAATGALLRYMHELQPGGVPHLSRPVIERPGRTMPLDEMTRRNLELVESLRGGDTSGTLLSVMDRTLTPMGARLLRQWILTPLTDRNAIEARLNTVDLFADDPMGRESVRSRHSTEFVMFERLASKAAAGRGTPRDLRALGDSVARLPRLHASLEKLAVGWKAFVYSSAKFSKTRDACADISADIVATIVENPPLLWENEVCIRGKGLMRISLRMAVASRWREGCDRANPNRREEHAPESIHSRSDTIASSDTSSKSRAAKLHLVPA